MRIEWSFHFDENSNRNLYVKARQFLAPPLVFCHCANNLALIAQNAHGLNLLY